MSRWPRQARGEVSRRYGWRLSRNLPVLSLAYRWGARANGEDPRFDPLVAAATAVLCVSEGRLLRER